MEKDGRTVPVNWNLSNSDGQTKEKSAAYSAPSVPEITLPKGGGAIKSINEKFEVNAANGTAGFSVPFPFSPSRNSFVPQLALTYNSGSGNGIFGLGWNAEPLSISRKTENKLPFYNDAEESDIFLFSGADDLVPFYEKETTGTWTKKEHGSVQQYRPRIEGGFARIEKITEDSGNVYWKVTSKDNVVSVFGKSKAAQLRHPSDETKIFKWLLEFCYDDKGDCYQFEYKKEDKQNLANVVHEKNRLNDFSRTANTYLKRVKYGNKNHLDKNNVDFANWETFLSNIQYLLQLVLDYGEHDEAAPQPNEDNGWPCRQDAFSDYRAGFEIRTYRLCHRLLMFHRFTELGEQPCLVRSMDFDYNSGTAFTFLQSITQRGFIRDNNGVYAQKSFPPFSFTYQPLEWNTDIKSLSKETLENLPVGIDDRSYQWIDLYSEGLSGLLTEQATGWYYKRNLGDGNFEPLALVSPKPSLVGLSTGTVHFQDLEAAGKKQAVSNELHGFFELDEEEHWQPFQRFKTIPNIDSRDQNVKYIDLDGDGRADLLVSEENVFLWYASKGKLGYDDYSLVSKSRGEERSVNVVFNDNTQAIVVADMSGDGLPDIVRIRNHEIVYWPNLGYGKFGAKVTMSNAPLFDHPDHFHPAYVKLADLDGSGTTDVVYLAKDSFKIYFNQSGNAWSEVNIVNGINPLPFPKVDVQTKVAVVDLLGNGTGCVVWSSPLPKHASNPLRYIDLMGGKKPHLLSGWKNNTGKEVTISYQPSTRYYLDDKKDGIPWLTKLPFPVQCVSQIETLEQTSKARFTSQYTYHHGYYDYYEREFRGFGRVEQTDTEDYENYKKNVDAVSGIQIVDEGLHEPPVLTKTWFHTGAFLDKEKILTHFAQEYYQNAIWPEKILVEPSLPDDLTIDEWREALRACKGLPLRVEVYAMDGSEEEQHPYTTAQHACLLQMLQPKLANKYAVFTVQQSEALTYTYERNPADPRIAQNMTIDVDEFGNVLEAATITYGRKTVDANLTSSEQAEQSKTHVVFSANNFTNKIDDDTNYRLPLLCEAKTFELTGLAPFSGDYFSIDGVKNDFLNATEIAYEKIADETIEQKRLIKQVRSVFLKNDLSEPLPLGQLESLAMLYQSYKLALTPALVASIFGDKVTEDLLLNSGKYVHSDDENYWIPFGLQTYDAANFYQVTEIADAFGNKTQITYDDTYHFFIQQTTDALQNKTAVSKFNCRTLFPYLITDSNDNRKAVRFDELGLVVSMFVTGKEGENKGDFFDPDSAEISVADKPGTLIECDLFQYVNSGKPAYTKTITDEIDYFYSLQTNEVIATQTSYTYFNGNGDILMKKTQAEPGIALQETEDGTVTQVDTSPNLRWIGTGRTIINNKGKPVKQYEPYFSVTPGFEEAKELVERGVTTVLYYDSLGRVERTEFPDGTFSKTDVDVWKQRIFDQNDTVLESVWYNDRINRLLDAEFNLEGKDPVKEKEAAQKAAAHANTPVVSYLDSLGRSFLRIADNGSQGKYKTTSVIDVEGNLLQLIDARGNAIMQYKYDMLGNQLYSKSADAGERWIFSDVMGKPVQTWDNRQQVFRYEYDALHRPVKSFVAKGTAAEITFSSIVYGEGIANDKEQNLRGKVYRQFDSAGVITSTNYDFKGNLLQSSRQLCREFKNDIDWKANPSLEAEIFVSSTEYDALNRPILVTAPDKSIITPSYNEAALFNKMEVRLKGVVDKTVFVKSISYNEKGQRQSIVYGNDTKTNYKYDKQTFRLLHLTTNRKNETDSLQKLSYTYDAVGNITYVKDEAQQTFFYNNALVEPSCDYVYDALYQLIQASGREHIGQNTLPQDNWRDDFFTNLVHKGDGLAMRTYTQNFLYDAVGNILQLKHIANSGSYTRDYTYEAANNRLTSTKIAGTTFTYAHDEHGNMAVMPHLSSMQWNFKDRLQNTRQTVTNNGIGEQTFYVYDENGQRIRKLTTQPSGNKKEERIYLGGFEIYRSYKADGTTVELERETLHVTDDKTRVALVETKTKDNGSNDATVLNKSLIRYQLANGLGSAYLELNESAEIISYEEYHPYGTTSYQAINKSINPIAKRYRYAGRERDEESGFGYHNARYYLPWLGRWLSADPIGIKGGINLYQYAYNNPVTLSDASGLDPAADLPLPNVDYHFKGTTVADPKTEAPNLKLKDDNYEDKYGDRLPVNKISFRNGSVGTFHGHLNIGGDVLYDNGDPMSDPTTIHLKLQTDYSDWKNLRLHSTADISIGDGFKFANLHLDANVSLPKEDIVKFLAGGHFDTSHLNQFLKDHPLRLRGSLDILSLNKIPGVSYLWDAIRPRIVYNAWLDMHGKFNSDLHLYPVNILPAGVLAPTPYPAAGYEYRANRGGEEYTVGTALSSKIDPTDLSVTPRSFASLYGSLKTRNDEVSLSAGYYSPPTTTLVGGVPDALRKAGPPDTQGFLESTSGWSVKLFWKHNF